jgi:hypothetical protein
MQTKDQKETFHFDIRNTRRHLKIPLLTYFLGSLNENGNFTYYSQADEK